MQRTTLQETPVWPPGEYLRRMRSSAVYNVVDKTPLDSAPDLSMALGRSVLLKREDLQPVHSFKLRGAYHRIAQLQPEEFRAGVVAASAGNHAQGVAYAARILGTRATIVVPRTTPTIKQKAIRRLGADLILHGDDYDEALGYALEIGEAGGKVFIHPYDHPDIIVGQGTIGLELHDQAPADLEAVFVPVGGGGLLSGIAMALKQLRPKVKIFGVEAVGSDAMSQSLSAGVRITLDQVDLFADGCAVRTVGKTTFELVQRFADGIIRVTNDEICATLQTIFEERRAVVEPSGALGLAGLVKWTKENPGPGSLVTVLSGANLNFERLGFITERAKLGNRSEGLLAIRIPERPGTFLRLCQSLGGRNITEFNYRMGDPGHADVFVGLEISDDEDLQRVIGDVETVGFSCEDLSADETAKLHVRHMVGGRSPAKNERIFRVEFPERPGALLDFLLNVKSEWNISLFHYRNHGSDRGRALVGFQASPESAAQFDRFLARTSLNFQEQTGSSAVRLFLSQERHP